MDLKKTKIVATISDKHCEVDFIKDLYEAGMNVVRINSAHLNQAGALRIINNVRAVSDKIAILLDTKGPEIRTVFSDEPLVIKKDALYEVVGEPEGESKGSVISVTYDDFEIHVPVGARVLIDDGDVELVVLEKKNGTLLCRASNDGLVGSKKSVNVPGVKINLPSVSQRDREFLKFAVENEIDFIAHSFVRSA
ncbi:MAG: pyruvate kinase, partial [Bacteroidales bacterium]|nr:pyruvate kinase [Bacteroidales bacterium]